MAPRTLTRRDVLAGLAPGLLALRGLARARALPAPSVELSELAERFRRCDREEALDVATRAIRGGLDLKTLLGGVFQAGVLDIRPRHVGGKLHAVMMVESAFQLAEAADSRSAWLLALWNLDDFKESQQLDRAEGDWVLPRRPSVSFATEGAARGEFLAAMEAWDDERADRAIVGLLPYHDRASLFEVLWPLAARSYVNIGHKMIFAAQVERVLARIGWPNAEPALRSLVNGLLYRPSGTETEAFEHGRELAASLPETLPPAKEDPASSQSLLGELRDRDSRSAQKRMVAAFREGVGPASAWDALRLWASELFLRRARSQPAHDRAALLPVHAVTVTNAFGHAWRATSRESTRRLMILQATGWLPQLRDDLVRIAGLEPKGRTIDTLDVRTAPPFAAYRARLVSDLARRGVEHHQHKYAAAMLEESQYAHPRWAPHLLACAAPYLPGEAEPETDLCRRSLDALGRAGVLI